MKLIDIGADERRDLKLREQPVPEDALVIHSEAFRLMSERGGRWAVYQNADISSFPRAGHIKCLKFGHGCTFETPPPHYPAPTITEGHNYLFVGEVDFSQTPYETRVKEYKP
jgi:hypothetical protein